MIWPKSGGVIILSKGLFSGGGEGVGVCFR